MAKEKSEKEMPFGIKELAKHLGVQPATARVTLRNNKVKKNGRSYGWSSKTEMEKVAKSLKATAPAKAAKPAKKAKAKATKKAKASEDRAAA